MASPMHCNIRDLMNSVLGPPVSDQQPIGPGPEASPVKLTQTSRTRAGVVDVQHLLKRVSQDLQIVNKEDTKGTGFKQFRRNRLGKFEPVVARNQLANSFKAFNNKAWPQLETLDTRYRCRPFSSKAFDRKSRALSGYSQASTAGTSFGFTETHRRRPKSAAATLQTYRTLGAYEGLDREAMKKLGVMGYYQRYGNELKPPKLLTAARSRSRSPETSSQDESKSGESSDERKREGKQSSDSMLSRQVSTKMEMRRLLRSNNFQLRPDSLDDMCALDGYKERSRFDFDASRAKMPIYYFPDVMPEELQDVRLKTVCCSCKDVRDLLPIVPRSGQTLDNEVAQLANRLLEMGRHVIQTKEWEEDQERRLRAAARERRVRSAKLREARQKDRNCCASCLQPACAGDCLEKQLSSISQNQILCVYCRQKFCVGSCRSFDYQDYARTPTAIEKPQLSESPTTDAPFLGRRAKTELCKVPSVDEDKTAINFDQIPASPPKENLLKSRLRRPRSGCRACKPTATTTKLINANNIIMGRPQSVFSTYSFGKQTAVKPRDFRTAPLTRISLVLSERFESCDIPPHRAAPKPVKLDGGLGQLGLKGRNALYPGKSYYSQRRESLTSSSKLRSVPS